MKTIFNSPMNQSTTLLYHDRSVKTTYCFAQSWVWRKQPTQSQKRAGKDKTDERIWAYISTFCKLSEWTNVWKLTPVVFGPWSCNHTFQKWKITSEYAVWQNQTTIPFKPVRREGFAVHGVRGQSHALSSSDSNDGTLCLLFTILPYIFFVSNKLLFFLEFIKATFLLKFELIR